MSFTASPIASTFAPPNQLFDSAAGITAQQVQQNQLMTQQKQLDLSSANVQQSSQAAAGLLSAYPDEASRAAAWPKVIGQLQSQGFAMHAPSQYPGEATLRAMVNMGLSPKDLYASGALTAPGLTDALARANAPLPGQPGYGGGGGQLGVAVPPMGGGAPGASATVPAEYMPYFQEASQKTGIPVDLLIAQARQESGFNPNAKGAAGEVGMFQIKPSTAQSPGGGMAGVDPASITGPGNVRNNILFGAQYLRSRMNGDPTNPQVQVQGLAAYNGGGDPNYVQNVFRYRPAPTAPGTATASAAPPAAPPGAATAPPAPNQFAGPGAPPGAAPPAATPAQTPATGDQFDVPAAAAPAQPTPSAPAPGAAAQPPAATPAPAGTAQPSTTPPTGVNSPQFQAALELNNRAAALETAYPNSPQAKAQVAALRAKAALYMQADSVSYDPVTGIGTKALTGERLNAAAPDAHYVWNAEQGAFVDTTGTHPPVTPPSPRITNIPGVGAVQSKPGGGATVVVPMNPAGITTQSAAQAAGTAAGSETGKLTGQLADQGRTSTQAIGNIDYGLSQLAKAQQGGINTGYFAPWLATVGAVAKSLGVPTEAIGVDPAAVGNIQTAQKTLAVVSGAILQQVLGPDSQITDAKLSHFIHAQPGIETDPEAVSRVLNWARSQFVYEREQAAQGMKDAAAGGGVLPTNWESSYYDKHGFAPIYNPGTGEMQQPDGTAPPRTAPPATQTAPVNPSNRTAGTTYNTPKGPLKWTGTGWVTP